MKAFHQSYPLSLKQVLLTPSIECHVLNQFDQVLLWPSISAVKTFSKYFEHSENAIRTSLSRAKKNGDILIAIEQNNKRIQLGEKIKDIIAYYLDEPFTGSSFSLLTFQFKSNQGKTRYRLKELLDRLNYIKLTQNTYIRYGSHPDAVEALLKQNQLDQYVYHFHHIESLPSRLMAEIPERYALNHWAPFLKQFNTRFQHYLSKEPIQSEAGYLRYLYARSTFHNLIMIQAPYLPESLFTDVTITKSIYHQLSQIAEDNRTEHAQIHKAFFDDK